MKKLSNPVFIALLVAVLIVSLIGSIVIENKSVVTFNIAFLISYLVLAFSLSLKVDKVLHKID